MSLSFPNTQMFRIVCTGGTSPETMSTFINGNSSKYSCCYCSAASARDPLAPPYAGADAATVSCVTLQLLLILANFRHYG